MNPVALQLGPISIRWYAICIVSGLILAVYLSMKEAPRKKITSILVRFFFFFFLESRFMVAS